MHHEDAEFIAQALVETNLWGIDSHGVLRVPIYIKRLLAGSCNPKPEIKTVKSAITLEILHGDDGAGQIVGRDTMLRAIELAKTYNLGIVGALHSNHFGAAATFARMAVSEGMIGVAMTNVVQNVVAPGGSKPIIGNNPFAIAVPTFGEFPFVLDISLSAVSGGKLLLARKKGEKIPQDWGTDNQGRPTNDPDEAWRLAKRHGNRLVAKALYSPLIEEPDEDFFVFTNAITATDLAAEEEIKISPSIFQQCLSPKIDYRVTVVGETVFPVRVGRQNQKSSHSQPKWH